MSDALCRVAMCHLHIGRRIRVVETRAVCHTISPSDHMFGRSSFARSEILRLVNMCMVAPDSLSELIIQVESEN